MSHPDSTARTFAALGLGELEARIYVFLLQNDGATGYRVANGVGGSYSNIYKTLANMQERGIVLADEGQTRRFSAVAPEALLDRLEQDFRGRREKALAAARDLPRPTGDTSIYQLASAEQVVETVRRMLTESRERVLVEIYPLLLDLLKDDIEAAAARGVVVAARIYRPAELAGVTTILSPFGTEDWNIFPCQWLGVYVDGCQYLQASLTPDGREVHQAVWSASPLLAWSLYSHVNADFHHYAFRPHLLDATDVDELRARYEELQELFPVGGDLGYRGLGKQLGYDRNPDAGGKA